MKKSMKKGLIFGAAFLSALTLTVACVNGTSRMRSNADTAAYSTETGVECAVLKSGSKGNEVKEVQRRLKLWGYYKGSVDGVFGAGTRSAVIAFQKKNGLTADGVVGKATYKALGMNSSYQALVSQSGAQNGGVNGYTSSDVYLLARTIYAEGRGEPYVGQVAIAAVVLNRVDSKKFPNTISGVIYQKGAFTCVDDGQINYSPNSTAYKAAKDALNGWDPTNGCLYYYNPATATSKWIWSLKVELTIGRHSFARG